MSTTVPWDETTRPSGPVPDGTRPARPEELAAGQQLVLIHDHLRAELEQLREVVDQVLDGAVSAATARSAIAEVTIRQNNWTTGAYCAAYCRLVTTHHSIEDQWLFTRLRRADPRLGPVVDRLHAEHEVIHEVLDSVDRALVDLVARGDRTALHQAVEALATSLLSHLAYEERELVGPIGRLGIGV